MSEVEVRSSGIEVIVRGVESEEEARDLADYVLDSYTFEAVEAKKIGRNEWRILYTLVSL